VRLHASNDENAIRLDDPLVEPRVPKQANGLSVAAVMPCLFKREPAISWQDIPLMTLDLFRAERVASRSEEYATTKRQVTLLRDSKNNLERGPAIGESVQIVQEKRYGRPVDVSLFQKGQEPRLENGILYDALWILFALGPSGMDPLDINTPKSALPIH
jgi:hypothetical protein